MKKLFIDLGLGLGISIAYIFLSKRIEEILSNTNIESDIESSESSIKETISNTEVEPDIELVSSIKETASSRVVYNNYRTLPSSSIGYFTRIKDIPQLKRWANALKKERIYTVSDLIDRADKFYGYSVKEIYSYDGIGEVGIKKIKRFLQSYTGNYYRCPTKKPTYWSLF